MFETVVHKLVKTVGADLYIPSSSLAASENLFPLAVVERKASRWWLGNNTYYTTEFSLAEVLDKGEFKVDAEPAKDLVAFNKTSTVKVNGSLSGHFKTIFDAELSNVDTITVKANLGDLHFTEVHEQSLLDSLQNRKLNIQHELIRELQAKKRRALCVVIGVVKTTTPTTITATLNLRVDANEKVTVPMGGQEAKGDLEDDKTRTLDLPAGTVLAYQVAELSVSKQGDVRLMVSHGAKGGFNIDMTDSKDPHSSSGGFVGFIDLDTLKKDLEGFTALDVDKRRVLTKNLLDICRTKDALIELAMLLNLPEKSSKTAGVDTVLTLMSDHRQDNVTLSLQVVVRALKNLDEEALSHLSTVPVDHLPLMLSIIEATYTGTSLAYSDEKVHLLTADAPQVLHFLVGGINYKFDGDGLHPPAQSSQHLLNSVYATVYGLHSCYY